MLNWLFGKLWSGSGGDDPRNQQSANPHIGRSQPEREEEARKAQVAQQRGSQSTKSGKLCPFGDESVFYAAYHAEDFHPVDETCDVCRSRRKSVAVRAAARTAARVTMARDGRGAAAGLYADSQGQGMPHRAPSDYDVLYWHNCWDGETITVRVVCGRCAAVQEGEGTGTCLECGMEYQGRKGLIMRGFMCPPPFPPGIFEVSEWVKRPGWKQGMPKPQPATDDEDDAAGKP